MKRKSRGGALAEIINKNDLRIGAEVGCLTGDLTEYLFQNCPKLELLFAVDLWDYRPDLYSSFTLEISNERGHNEKTYQDIYEIFIDKMERYKGKIEILKGISWEVADNIENGSLDFVFIDADHGYETVTKDMLAWVPKVREGGMVCGHDYNIPGVKRMMNEMVPNAVKTICQVWSSKKEDVIYVQ